jgi:CheY-like chemotaxis protein
MSFAVLVVEDDLEIRESLLEVLEEAGYAAQGAANGRAALTALAQGPKPGLILLDLMMPVLDGAGFREAQLADPEIAHIPVVIISAYHDVPTSARQLGVSRALKKPIDLDQLLALVGEVALDNKRH